MSILVSACLLGIPCRHDGKALIQEAVSAYAGMNDVIPICPEQLGGLATPRTAAEIVGGDGDDVLAGRARVIDQEGSDVTREYLRGAAAALRIARIVGADRAVLKARSPSCGRGEIYDGTHSGTLRGGDGVATALLRQNGIEVVTEEQFKDSRVNSRQPHPPGTWSRNEM